MGAGFDGQMLHRVANSSGTGMAPSRSVLAIRHAAHWAEPELVVQIGFARWTCDCEPRAVSLA